MFTLRSLGLGSTGVCVCVCVCVLTCALLRCLLHRAIFFKGSKNFHRTPSMWLLPNSNRVTYRVMGEGEKEVWGSSLKEIELERWTHLTLTVGKRPNSSLFVMALYINGEIDSEVESRAVLLHSGERDLLLGKDVGKSKGMTGFMAQLQVRSGGSFFPLSTLGVRREFQRAASNLSQIIKTESHRTCEREDVGDDFSSLCSLPQLFKLDDVCPLRMDEESEPAQNLPAFSSNWELLKRTIYGKTDGEKVPVLLQLAWKNKVGMDGNPQSCDTGKYFGDKSRQLFL